jgi:hypothetical protein
LHTKKTNRCAIPRTQSSIVAMQQEHVPQRNSKPISGVTNPPRRIAVKKISLSIAAVVAVSIASATTGFAAELPTYEVKGLPISPVQVGMLGAANVQEQVQVATSAASPHQLSVLTPRPKLKAATASTTGLAAH